MLEMPEYQCHKTVWALKIKDIELLINGTAVLTFEKEGYAPLTVTESYVQKHAPEPGGYFITYKDGYTSWSPADVFEAGYTRI